MAKPIPAEKASPALIVAIFPKPSDDYTFKLEISDQTFNHSRQADDTCNLPYHFNQPLTHTIIVDF